MSVLRSKSASLRSKVLPLFYTYAAYFVFVAVFVVFSFLSDTFLEPQNLVNILVQSAALGIVAVGMTFVLLVAGIDLSVGSTMFLSAAVAVRLLSAGFPLWVAFLSMIVVGVIVGLINGLLSTKFGVPAFLVTLAVLYMGRGLGLLITETQQWNLPQSFLRVGQASILGIPSPVIIFAIVVVVAHFTLTKTPLGRQIYAIGDDRAAAEKAGIRVAPILILVFTICGVLAAVGGMVAVAQAGAVQPNFASGREFTVIAAAVLGGTSLFGGRGSVFPGSVMGAVLLLTIENGLNLINANPYSYPVISASIIFLAVLVDSLRNQQLSKLGQRKIRAEEGLRPFSEASRGERVDAT